MAREVQLISTTKGAHYLIFGLGSGELSNFAAQMWLEKKGARAAEWFQSMNLSFASFLGADIWIHNSDDVDRCSYYGERKDCEVGVVANDQPTVIKSLDSLAVGSDHEWEITSVYIPPSVNYPDGMSSKIPKGKFKKREGVLYAEFLRNMKSSSGVESVLDALRGETLRGYIGYMVMTNTDTDQVKLFRLKINMTTSKV
jgi:hypothetical protein